MKRAILFLAISILSFGCATLPQRTKEDAMIAVPQQKANEDTIGVAEMTKNRTIILQLRAEDSGGAVGSGYFTYPPTHPDYQKVLDHVGPLKPGQSVFVRA